MADVFLGLWELDSLQLQQYATWLPLAGKLSRVWGEMSRGSSPHALAVFG